jgi:phosphoesterase RecJ-like protein
MISSEPAAAAAAFKDQIDRAERILLLSHVNPDGDAIGSMLGAFHALQAMGKTAIPLASSEMPAYAAALPGIEHVTVYEPGTSLPASDLIWMLDTATLARVGPIFDEHAEELRRRPLVITDHHVTNDGGGDVNLIAPDHASTADLLLRLLQQMQAPITADAATCLLLGTITDTQSFQTSSTSPETLRTAADLLAAGADLQRIVRAVYFAIPASTVQLSAMALAQMQSEDGLYWVRITQAMLQATGAEDEATDEAVMRMQRIDGVRAVAMFKERSDGAVKISLRSASDTLNVAEIARIWGGGGHARAAGATLQMSLDEAEAAVLPVLREALRP